MMEHGATPLTLMSDDSIVVQMYAQFHLLLLEKRMTCFIHVRTLSIVRESDGVEAYTENCGAYPVKVYNSSVWMKHIIEDESQW